MGICNSDGGLANSRCTHSLGPSVVRFQIRALRNHCLLESKQKRRVVGIGIDAAVDQRLVRGQRLVQGIGQRPWDRANPVQDAQTCDRTGDAW